MKTSTRLPPTFRAQSATKLLVVTTLIRASSLVVAVFEQAAADNAARATSRVHDLKIVRFLILGLI